MDSGIAIAVTFLRAVADVRSELKQFQARLGDHANIVKTSFKETCPRDTVRWHWDEDQRRHSVTIEYCLLATFTDDSMVDWTFTISGDPRGWYGELSVDHSDVQKELDFGHFVGAAVKNLG